MAQALKLLAIFPHPDDETLGMGGTLAKYAAEGVDTRLICATRGERGTLIVSIDSLARMSSNPFFDYVMQRIEEGLGKSRP